jgi:Family of unknown function (DUF6502)
MSDLGPRLVSAAAQALLPLVKRLLAAGVPFGQLEGRLRELFVEVAEAEFALPGRRQTDSRVSLLTGINRKEVRRIRAAERGQRGPTSFGMNHATSLISRWLTDARTVDRRGRPRPLPYQAARGPSFMKLARAVTADLAPRVLLDELLRSGAAELRDGDVVALRSTAYVARSKPEETLRILEEDPRELIETILRNVFAEGDERLLQRKVYFDNLGSHAAAQVRAEMRREGERFLQRINGLLARYDRDRNPRAPGGERHYAGVGVYFFEDAPPPAASAAPAPRRARRRTSKEPKR